MKSVGLLVIICIVTFGYTEPPDTLWTKTYGGTANDVGNSIKQTSDGGYIIAGYTESFGAGEQDVWLLKTDANGNTIWTKTYGGADDDWAEDVQLTGDGGFVIAANTNSFPIEGHIWLIKTDSMGDTVWTKIHDCGFGYCHSIQLISDGGYIVAGDRQAGLYDRYPLLLKTNTVGNIIWIYVAGFGYGQILDVLETYDGGYIAVGRLGPFGNNSWYAKFTWDGDTLWSNIFLIWDGLNSVNQMSDSGFIACGWTSYSNLLIIRTNEGGDTLWTRIYDDYLLDRNGNSGYLTNDDGYVITGMCGRFNYWEYDLLLFKVDENGDSLWSVAYGDSGYWDVGNEVLQTNDGGYIVVGFTESYGAGGKDIWLLKTEPDVGVEENEPAVVTNNGIPATIFGGPLQLPEGKTYRVFDITGRVVEPTNIQPGIYFIEVDGVVTQKVVKVR